MSLLDEIELVKGRKRKRDEVRVSNTKQIEKFKSSSVVDGISILPVTSQASSGSSEIGDHPTVSSLDSATESIKL